MQITASIPAASPLWRLVQTACVVLCLSFQSAGVHAQFSAGLAQAAVGQVMVVTGTVRAVDLQGKERRLEKGGEVRPGDKIVTEKDALTQVRMNDGGYLSIRSETEMSIDQFVHNEKEVGKSSFVMSLIKGGFRSITGLIGRSHPEGYRIKAATATIGIRGTDHEPMLILPSSSSSPAANLPGVYDKVNRGETYIQNERGLLSLKEGQIGFTPLKPDVAPQVVVKVPDFYKVNVKTDARDPKDAQNDKSDGKARTPAGAGALRPTMADRQPGGEGQKPGQSGMAGSPMLRPMTGTNPGAGMPPAGSPPPEGSPQMAIPPPPLTPAAPLTPAMPPPPPAMPPPPVLQPPPTLQPAPTLTAPLTTTTIIK